MYNDDISRGQRGKGKLQIILSKKKRKCTTVGEEKEEGVGGGVGGIIGVAIFPLCFC